MQYAVEVAFKFSAESDEDAKRLLTGLIASIDSINLASPWKDRGEFLVDEIRLVDDDFHRAFGQNRIIDLSDIFGETEDEEKGSNESGD